MKQEFVTFYSPGTFVAEATRKPIASWDIETAKAMSGAILERYDARPYGFRFSTWEREDTELDSKEVATSGIYYLGGTILTLEEIKARNDPADRILISNMECNGWSKVVTNVNSWKWTQPLYDNDVVLDMGGE